MRTDKRQARQRDKAKEAFMALLLEKGHDASEVETVLNSLPQTGEEKSLQAEAVLAHLATPTKFISKKCGWCKEIFSTNYRSVRYCSDGCRAKSIQSQTGIRWDPYVDRWRNLNAERPLVISPQVYAKLVEFAQAVLSQNQIEIQAVEEQSASESPVLSLPPQEPSYEESRPLNGVLHTNPAGLLPASTHQSSEEQKPSDYPFDF